MGAAWCVGRTVRPARGAKWHRSDVFRCMQAIFIYTAPACGRMQKRDIDLPILVLVVAAGGLMECPPHGLGRSPANGPDRCTSDARQP